MFEERSIGQFGMAATSGRVVVTPEQIQPYKVVLEHAHSNDTEHAVASVREGEAIIRSEVPIPQPVRRQVEINVQQP
jgi:hypothetical protein